MRNDRYEGSHEIAIVGAGCRLPGADDPEELWELLTAGRDTVGTVPADRFDVDRWYDPDSGAPDSIRSRHGGYLERVHDFDPGFFGITAVEADQMDPQQRHLLEVAWQALEDAGRTAPELAGSSTGVYLSIADSGYAGRLAAAGRRGLFAYMGRDPGPTTAGRLAYHLDLRGPVMSVGASCASGLASLHLATRALRDGEIDLAVIGASNIMLSAEGHLALSDADMLSPGGRSRFGDSSADGMVRSEGVVVLVLKRRADAERDGDRSYATVRGTSLCGTGRDGGSATSPGTESQEQALRAAYRDAGVEPSTVEFVEAHGPGTAAGDPVELRALTTVLGEARAPGRPCLVGSVKSNIGHTELPAGLAGLLKAALALRHRELPPTLHVTDPVPLLADPAGPLRHAARLTPLPADRPVVAGVSSFGLAGTVGHAVLESATPREEPVTGVGATRDAFVLPVSGASPEAMRAAAVRMADLVESADGPHLADLCHSAGARRTHHPHRVAVVGRDGAELARELRGAAARRVPPPAVRARRHVAFVFPGQGTRAQAVGQALHRADPVFAAAFDECAAAVEAELGWSPAEALDGRPLEGIDRIHPATWAVQVSLAATLRAAGVVPDVVVGHSMGEIAAAVCAGALTVADGAAVVARRARLLTDAPPRGAMWAVELGEDEARAAIAGCGGRVCVGVINGPRSTVLSGDAEPLGAVVESLHGRGVACRRITADCASHSPQAGALSAAIGDSLGDVRPRRGDVPMHSTTVGAVVDGTALDAAYWAAGLRRPVLFGDVVASVLAEHPDTLFLEVNPVPVLRGAVEDGIEAVGADAQVCSVLETGRSEPEAVLDAVATAYAAGRDPDWARVSPGRFVPLPAYPWQHRAFGVGGAETPPEPDLRIPAPRRSATGPQRVAVVPDPRTAPVTSPAPDPLRACLDDVVERIAAHLGTAPDAVNPLASPADVGLSSVFAPRLAHELRTEIGVPFSTRDVLTAASIQELAVELHRRGRPQPVDPTPMDPTPMDRTPMDPTAIDTPSASPVGPAPVGAPPMTTPAA